MALLEYPDLTLEDFQDEDDDLLDLKLKFKINKDKVLRTIDKLWVRLDKYKAGYIEYSEAKRAVKKVLKVLKKDEAYDEVKFRAFFRLADENKDRRLQKEELLTLVD